ncbi:MAG: type II secretion system protein GspJ [Myxococcota bacterium]|nr:type II secretion system protein GspJ [Myxococcota bacterium]
MNTLRTKRGMTLIEIVISHALLSLIATLSLMTLSGTLRLRDVFVDNDTHLRAARNTMNRLQREIRLSFLTSNRQAVGTYNTVFIGKDQGEQDQIWFSTMAHHRKYFNAPEGDQSEITIWVESGPDDKGDVLLHRETGIIDHEPENGGSVLPMVEGVKRFNLRYLNSTTNEWIDEWDSTGVDTPNAIPRAVEILLEIEYKDNEDYVYKKTYLNTVMLELAKPLTRSLLSGSGNGPKLGGMLP